MVYPRNYDRDRAYPVIVMLPASNGTSMSMYRTYGSVDDAIVLLAEGTGTTADYATNSAWAATIARYERRIFEDLHALESRGVRVGPVILTGFSMGGDLSWALALRNPTRISGVLIMGSQCTYRAPATDLRVLADRQVRFFFAMGSNDLERRVAGARAATRLLDDQRIPQRYQTVPGAGHERLARDVWERGLEFVLRDH